MRVALIDSSTGVVHGYGETDGKRVDGMYFSVLIDGSKKPDLCTANSVYPIENEARVVSVFKAQARARALLGEAQYREAVALMASHGLTGN